MSNLKLKSRHRLLCGDSTSKEDVARLMDGEICFDLITDPPYGTGISTQKGLGNSKMPMNLVGDSDTTLAKRAYTFWKKRGELQVWFGANYYSELLDGSKCWIVWDKDHHGMTFADAELAFVNNDSPVRVFRHAWSGSHRASEKGVVRGHPTQKPIALFAWILEKYSKEKLCVDPFLGSGTTLIACEQLNRKCYGMEIDPRYCDVIVARWEALTNQKAVLHE